ncbi:MAG: hypothetical protein IGS49_17660 [Chlorogloeopsis fritschii C42_A2020_084]|uniref:hypothetical protein n=1 Tax=Chlorogloeopsis fritschii TaxID=1124 RepID=UPI001A0B1708|nr:hypothetical protein [Chlorogloeopsis fritschii]MBF2007236.1 hypothetical protein [Chlorogloeopsis fritschii C42_A2020_084]
MNEIIYLCGDITIADSCQDQRSRLEALIEELGLSSEITLPGFVLNPCVIR